MIAGHTRDTERVRAEEHSDAVTIDVTLPTVHGVVLFGEAPASRALVHFDGAGTRATATTDDDGRFSLMLEKAGDYDVDVRTSPFVPGETRRVRVTDGPQELQLVFAGGRLAVVVRARGEELSEAVQVHLEGESGSRTAIATPEGFRAEFVGLRPGRYTLSATAHGGWVSPKMEIELDDHLFAQEIELVLERRAGRLLLVRSEDGRPLAGASVRVGATILAEGNRGEFEIPGDAGERAYVRVEGYPPVCRDFAPGENRVVIVPARGAFTATLQLAKEQLSGGTIQGLPGNNCPVSVLSMPHAISAGQGGEVILSLRALPSGRYVFTGANGSVAFEVPGDMVRVP